jgi:hypothetical protein
MRIVAITGSRDFPWRRSSEIAGLLSGVDLLIVGDAKGADAIARKLAIRNHIPVLECRANWLEHGKAAGPLRNAIMSKFAVTFRGAGHEVMCYAFPIGASPGTRGCVQLMKVSGIPVVIHEGE